MDLPDEFRRIFQAEADERLAILSDGVLRLERQGPDAELLENLFRSAHSLKGAAAVVGVDDVARVAHVMEELLSQLRAGTRGITPLFVEALLEAIDGIMEMLPALLAGEDRTAVATTFERRLQEALAEREDTPAAKDAPPTEPPTPAPADAQTAAPAEVHPREPQEPVAEPSVAAVKRSAVDDIVRVPVERLDELVRLVGETAAALLRLGQQLGV
ncbi:MAG: Hpt domain-containing protein, partial [Actinobacteria bacterium]|nr:Hpt domain-containing protein [Actinomycetota bacterium]